MDHGITRKLTSNCWIQNPLWDGFWVFSGFWLLFIVAVSPHGHFLGEFYLWAMLIMRISHRFGTMYLAFCVPSYRPVVRQNHVRVVIFPMIIFLTVMGVLLAPQSVIPVPFNFRVSLFLMAILLGDIRHIAYQHYGIMSIYRMKSQQSLSSKSKGQEKNFCLLVGGWIVLLGIILNGLNPFYSKFLIKDLLLLAPSEYLRFSNDLRYGATLLIVFLLIRQIHLESEELELSPSKILYSVMLSIFGICALFLAPLPFILAMEGQHFLTAFALAGHMSVPRQPHRDTPCRGFWKPVLIILFPGLVISLGLGMSYFMVLPVPLSQLSGSITGHFLITLILALNFTSSFAHYLFDGLLFRFSDPLIRKTSLQALMNPLELLNTNQANSTG